MDALKTNRLRVARAERRMTQLDLARAAGVSQSTLSLIENGYVEPTPDQRADFARILETPETELFPGVAA